MYNRIVPIQKLIKHKSLFLLGPRQVGKSTLLRALYPNARYIDLLEADTFRTFTQRPEVLRERLNESDHIIIIDEIQKLPALLDEVQGLIDKNKKLRFILTGSSARKLKRGHSNLLPGRVWNTELFPLVSQELSFEKLDKRISIGSLPGIIDSEFPQEELNAYVGNYFKEEIQAEGLSRSIENFSRFLTAASHSNTKQINFTSVGSDCGVPARTVREYYQILEDTLIGYLVEPYQKTKKRKPVSTSKFYFFDIGVANCLLNRENVKRGSPEYGENLEHLIFLEVKAYLSYQRLNHTLCYWRSQSKMEVDFVIGDEIAIEVKAKNLIVDSDLKGLKALMEERLIKKYILISFDKEKEKIGNIEVWPVELFLKALWANEIKF